MPEIIDGKTAAEVDSGKQFVTTAEMKALTDAIATAAKATVKTTAEAQTAAGTLDTVVTTFKGVIKTGTYAPPDAKPVTGVSLNESSVVLYSNTTPSAVTLTATVAPADASNKTVTWKSSDEGVATVEDGVVTAVADGSATITVTTEDGRFTDSCTVTVTTYSAPYNPPSNTTTKTETNEDGSKTTTVTDKKTGTITETTKYPDGKMMETVTKKDGSFVQNVTESDGKKIATVATAEGNKSIAVTSKDGKKVAELNIPAEIPAPEKSFADVPETHWAKTAADFVSGMGLFTGTTADTFSGEMSMTRGMLTTVLHRLSGKISGGENRFGDVDENAWYADSVTWAAGNGIVTGTTKDNFAPEESLTRETLAVMLYRYAGLLGLDTGVENTDLATFSDGEAVSDWAHEAMAWAVKAGIIKGSSAGLLPGSTATRAEVAVMLQRFVETAIK